MANNWTPAQIHHFDQNTATYGTRLAKLVDAWNECLRWHLANGCCEVHALENFTTLLSANPAVDQTELLRLVVTAVRESGT